MNGPIKLTPIQEREVARRISHSSGIDQLHRVRDFVETINEVLAGDPIGTVRVSGPGVAVKFRHDQGGYGNWTVAGEDDDGGVPAYTCESDECVASWPVVYRPGGDT